MTAPPRNQLPPWHQRVVLSNGRELLIRPIRPADAEPLHAGFPLLMPDEVRRHFLPEGREMTPERAHRLATPDPRSEFVLVAVEPYPAGEALVGAIARLFIEPGTRRAHFSILVGRHLLGMGLGRQMMGRLVRWAKAKKLHELHGDVAENNPPMLAAMASLGFVRRDHDDPQLARLALELGDPR